MKAGRGGAAAGVATGEDNIGEPEGAGAGAVGGGIAAMGEGIFVVAVLCVGRGGFVAFTSILLSIAGCCC